MPSLSDVPALIKALRAARGLTQEQLAQELGVSFSTVNSWENGRHRPIPALLKLIVAMARGCGALRDDETGEGER